MVESPDLQGFTLTCTIARTGHQALSPPLLCAGTEQWEATCTSPAVGRTLFTQNTTSGNSPSQALSPSSDHLCLVLQELPATWKGPPVT